MPTAERGHVVLSGTIGGQYARGSIIPPGTFEDDRIQHWVGRGAIRRANEDDIEAAKDILPSGSPVDVGSRAFRPTSVQQAEAAAAARENEISALEARLERLKKEHSELSERERSRAKEQEEARKAALEAQGLTVDPMDPPMETEGEEEKPREPQPEPESEPEPDQPPTGRLRRP